MYDVLVKSTLFGLRNADKVINTDDKGKILADVGQFTNAAKTAAQLDNAIGKGAQAAIDAMGSAAKTNKALTIAGRGADWASKHVNPLLIGAAGYRVLVSDDKENALKREIYGMSSMFAFEGAMKAAFHSDKMRNYKNNIANKKIVAGISILEGIIFVLGSIGGSTLGYKVGEHFYPKKNKDPMGLKLDMEKLHKIAEENKIAQKLPAQNIEAKKVDDIDESEYFALNSEGKTLA